MQGKKTFVYERAFKSRRDDIFLAQDNAPGQISSNNPAMQALVP